ncbi:hypothetical protein [Streptomyces sp. HPF1205]|uniref:hypothetical protein n=1 Tax=Streptomyces sp. HPF1205 TaxID=2873262 RepID=UPI0021F10EC3|nr:hypothetical protein [Streptomyces sp. HPF1205]
MTAELDDFLGEAVNRLARIPQTLASNRLSVGEYHALLAGACEVLREARIWIASRAGAPPTSGMHAWAGTPTAEVIREPLHRIRTAHARLRTSVAVRTGRVEPHPVAEPFADAARLLRLGRDVVRTHFDADGAPLTSYGRIAGTPGAHLYILARMGEVARHTATAVRRIMAAAPPEVLAEQPRVAEGAQALDRVTAIVRAATRGAPSTLATLPTAASLTPAALRPDETPAELLCLIAEGAQRLQQGADRAAHSDSAPALSGSDLTQIARPLALAHLLASRLLHTIGPELGEPSAALREAAQAWQSTAQAWSRIVDLGDPRAAELPSHPSKPYQYGHSGRPTPLPRPPAHPAITEAHHLAVRVGRLLFTGEWLPEHPGSAIPRSPQEILDAAGAPDRLTAALHPIPSAAATLATRAPQLLSALTPRLVTDDATYRPPTHPVRYRWFPIDRAQLATLASAYTEAAATSTAAARTIYSSLPRGCLDAVAPRQRTARMTPRTTMTEMKAYRGANHRL